MSFLYLIMCDNFSFMDFQLMDKRIFITICVTKSVVEILNYIY